MTTKLGWGILGLGNIAHQFARAIPHAPGAWLAAAGSRTQAKADAFGREFGAARAYGSYDGVLADPDVDCVYIATPHCGHYEDAMASLRAGKHVLCEKPFMVNDSEATEVIALAREKNLFCMEAMWTRFFPLMDRLREMIATGVIGEVRAMQADFSFRAAFDPNSRLYDPSLTGGALLDVGIYPLSLASMIFGKPSKISGVAHLGSTGVDEQNAVTLDYARGQHAVVTSAVSVQGFQEAQILGTDGRIRIHPPWAVPRALTLTKPDGPEETIEAPFAGNGYNYEIVETMRCIESGLVESPLMPLDETLENARIMTALRKSWHLKYPGEPDLI